MRILVAGSLAFDRILNFDGLFIDHIIPNKNHTINVSFMAPATTVSLGGAAGNIAYSLALLGEKPVILARAGNDFESYRDELKKAGVDTSLIEIDKSVETANATILTDLKDNQITAFNPGAMAKPCSVKELAGDFLIIAPTNPEDMRTLPRLARDAHIPFMFDPGQQITQLSTDDLRNGIAGSKVFISNDYELSLVMIKSGWSEAEILEQTEIMVTTLGDRGSAIKTKTATIEVPPAHPASIVDPTGAGDGYRAGFVHGMMKGWPLEVAGRIGSIIAAYSVETRGTQTHSFSDTELGERYKKNYGAELPN